MQTNGITKITVKGVIYPLLFGRAAVEEMSNRTAVNGMMPNRVKIFTDLIYSGMANYNFSKEIELPEYEDVYKIVDEFQDEEDAVEQHEKVWEVFQQSRAGKDWIKDLEEAKKKIDKAIIQMERKKKPAGKI